jgi:hypothetical protein
VAVLSLSVIAAAPAVAQSGTGNGSVAAKGGSSAAIASTTARQQPLARLAAADSNKHGFKQRVIKEFSGSSPSCIRGKTVRGKLRSGSTWTFTPTCLKLDTTPIGRASGKAASQRNVMAGPRSSTVNGLTPSSICPQTPGQDLTYDRFDLCTYEQLTQSGTLKEGPDTFLITVNFTVEMWAELQVPIAGDGNSRQWTVDAIVTPTSISNKSGAVFDAEAGLGCTDPVCTSTPDNGTPADGVLGTITPNVPLTASFGVDDTANPATLNINNVFQIVFLPDPSSGVPCTSNCQPLDVLWFGTQQDNPIRCDSQGSSYGYSASGCAVSVYNPIWLVSASEFPGMDLTVKHMAIATGTLAGFSALPGSPGRAYPLTYVGANSAQATANYNAYCATATAPSAEADAGNTSCDEYPFKSTAEGAASNGPFSICWVPPSDNTEQGKQLSLFLYDNRMLIDDQYYVDAIYQGITRGCNDHNLGGGNSPGADVPPPAEPLSNYEVSTKDELTRDCGFSAPVTAPETTAPHDLWLFCDSIDYAPDGTISSAILGTDSAAEAPLVAGEVPQDLTEVATPPSLSGLGGPEPFLPVPAGLTLPGSTSSCAGSSPNGVYGAQSPGIYPASWFTGVTPGPASGQVLMAYNNYCVDGNTGDNLTLFTDEGFGLVAYDPSTNALSQPENIFTTKDGTNLPQAEQLGSPIVSGGYLYLFDADCEVKAYATCGSGNVYLARVPLAGFTDSSQYRWWTGSTWSASYADAGNLVPGVTALSVSVGDYSSTGHGLVMVDETNLAGGFQVWTASTPTGPWTLLRTGTVPSSCQGGSFACYAVNGHPELSTAGDLMISYYDPAGNGHLHLAAVPWTGSTAAPASPSAARAGRAGTWPAAGQAAPGAGLRAP